jgi:hypothetical protein
MNPRLLRPTASGFNPLQISGLALWLDGADSSSLYTTDAGPVEAVAAPTDISGCVGWWDASDAATLFDADTGSTLATTTVGRWQDKSGQGNDLLQATAGSRPSITASALNGLPALTFDGTADFLRTASFTLNQPYEYLMVFRFDSAYVSATAPRVIDAGTQPSPGRGGEVFRNGTDDIRTFSGSSIVGSAVPSGQLQQYNLWSFSFNGASSRLRYRAGEYEVLGNPGANNGSRITLGADSNATAASFSGISVAEVIVYNAALSVADRARIEKYLQEKYALPAVHAPATATSDPVGYWGDKSGNNRHATQATAGKRPKATVTGLNSRRSVQFFGGNAELLTLGNLSAVFPTAGEVLVAFSPTNDTSYGLYETRANSSYFRNANGLSFFGTFSTGRQAGISVSMPTTGNHVVSMRNDNSGGATQVVRLDGAQVFAGVHVAGYAGGDSHVLGNNNNAAADTGLTGFIGEVIAFPRILATSERQRIERYLAAKWGITLAPTVSNADAQDWVNRVYANGGTVSTSTANAVNSFCNDIDAAGIRDRFYRLNLFAGNSDAALAAARTPLFRGPSLGGTQYGNALDTNTNFVAGDYAETGANGGLKGNATNKQLATGFAPLDASLEGTDSWHHSVYLTQKGSYIFGRLVNRLTFFNDGTDTTSGEDTHWNNTTLIHSNQESSLNLANVTTGMALGTTQSSGAAGWYNNVKVATDLAPMTNGLRHAATYYIFARNFVTNNAGAGTGTIGLFSDDRLGMYSFGLGMDDTQAQAFNAAAEAFQVALGRNA